MGPRFRGDDHEVHEIIRRSALVPATGAQLLADYGTWHMMIMGLVAVVVMLKATDGIWGFVLKRYDLHLFPVRRTLFYFDPAK